MRSVAIGIGVGTASFLGLTGGASAATWCVRDPGCPPGGKASQTTITGAVNASAAGDTVLIGPGRFVESVPLVGHELTIRGAGAARTIIQGAGPTPATTMTIVPGQYLEDVGIELAPGNNDIGLVLAGLATRIAVTEPAGVNGGLGVQMLHGALKHSTITLALGGSSTTVGAQLSPLTIAGGIVEDSTITAATGLDQVSEVERDKVHATVGFSGIQSRSSRGATYNLDNTLIVTSPGAMPETGIKMVVSPDATSNTVIAASCNCSHLTLLGSGSPGSTGFAVSGTSSAGQQAFNLSSLSESIVRGYATSLSRTAAGTGNQALVNISLSYSDVDPSTEHSDNSGTGSGSIFTDASDINADPLFVDTRFGDPAEFQLKVPSPAIDAGPPIDFGLSSPLDAAGAPRVLDGRNTGLPVADMGAFEYQPHAPTAVAHAPASARAGAPVTFSSAGSGDPDPGDVVTFAWRFDDGATASGPVVKHAFAKPGKHAATLIVTDLTHRAGIAVATVLVKPPAPRITHLTIVRGKIGYRDSLAATTSFSVLVRRRGHLVTVRSFKHHDRAGANSLKLKRHGLKPGRYRLRAVPRAAGQTGAAVSVSFRIQ